MGQGRSKAIEFTVDASVCVRWLVPGEEHEANAVKLRDDYVDGRVELYAPRLLTFEVLNVLWKTAERKHVSTQDAISLCRMFAKMAPTAVDLGERDLEEALQIAIADHITLYDASYIATATKTKSTMITADNDLYSIAKKHSQVLSLKDY